VCRLAQLSRTKDSKTSSKKKDSGSSSSQGSAGSSSNATDKRSSGDSNRSGDSAGDKTPSKSKDHVSAQSSPAAGSSALSNLHQQINNATPPGPRLIAPSVVISPSAANVCIAAVPLPRLDADPCWWFCVACTPSRICGDDARRPSPTEGWTEDV
jgi:hypothetical protein